MATVRELSSTLGVSGQSVRNYARKLGIVSVQGKTLEFTQEQASMIAYHFKDLKSNVGTFEGSSKENDENHSESFKDENHTLKVDLELLKQENTLLKSKIDDLEKFNAVLQEQLKATNEALEREQNISRGFWSRLGRKLLGDGK